MIRFAHIADVHLGYMQYNLVERYNDFVNAWLEVCKKVVNANVDFVIIAGDLFHHRSVGPETLSAATTGLAIFKADNIPVLAVEGNHEQPRNNTEVGWMEYLEDEGYLHLIDFRKDKNYYGEVAVYGMPWCGSATKSELQKFKAKNNDMFQILVLHGGVDTGYSGSFSDSDIDKHINYVALGHIHEPSINGCIITPGSLETCSIEEAQWNNRGAKIVEVRLDKSIGIRSIIPNRRLFNVYKFSEDGTVLAREGEVSHIYLLEDVQVEVIGKPLTTIYHKKFTTTQETVEGDIKTIQYNILKDLPDTTRKVLQMALDKASNEKIIGAL